ncbi:MAG: PqqD family protein [Acidobacteria bacterium]|nr:PqqD family protein [Acidobacteriota bacterium]
MAASLTATRLPAHVIATPLNDIESVLIDVQAKQYYQLNETATLIWRALERGLDQTQIAAALRERFDATPAQAAASVRRWLNELRECRLLHDE